MSQPRAPQPRLVPHAGRCDARARHSPAPLHNRVRGRDDRSCAYDTMTTTTLSMCAKKIWKPQWGIELKDATPGPGHSNVLVIHRRHHSGGGWLEGGGHHSARGGREDACLPSANAQGTPRTSSRRGSVSCATRCAACAANLCGRACEARAAKVKSDGRCEERRDGTHRARRATTSLSCAASLAVRAWPSAAVASSQAWSPDLAAINSECATCVPPAPSHP